MDLSQRPSDSLYSQTNTPAPSINHSLPNVAAQLESDSAEHCVPARSHNRKALNWRPNEDIALCQSWVRCSENLIIGTSPAGNSLWSRIFEDFCEQLPGTTRTKKSLENRWTAIQDDVTKWKTIVNRVHKDRSGSGGTNPDDEWGVCYKAFRDDHTRAFKFYHCWEILHHSVKWNDASSRKCDAVNTPLPQASLMHDSSGSMDLSQPSSDSSHSQTNILAPSITNDPPNVVTQLESNSAEHSSVPARTPNRKALNWRPNEDIALCQAWVRRSANLIIGTNQTANSLWNRIFEDFCEQLPGTPRTKKSLENRWTAIQDDVTKWKTIVNRVHKDRSGGGTTTADEWGVCYKAFRDDHTRDFKFYHCWEILHHSVKWNDTASGKSQDKPYSGSDPVNAPPLAPPASSPMHDSAGIDLDGLHDSSSMPSAEEDNPSLPSTPTEPTLSSIPSEALESPSGSESVREKRRRIEEAVPDNRMMDQFFECIKTQQRQIQMLQQNLFQMMQEVNMTQFDGGTKPVNECHSFHLVKKIKLEQLKLGVDIIQAIGDTEEKMISRAPHFMSDEVSDGRAARFKKLHELERKLDEIWQLQYYPGGNSR